MIWFGKHTLGKFIDRRRPYLLLICCGTLAVQYVLISAGLEDWKNLKEDRRGYYTDTSWFLNQDNFKIYVGRFLLTCSGFGRIGMS